MSEPELCSMEIYKVTLEAPAEYCDQEAIPGSDFCYEHDHELAGCCERDEPAEYDPFGDEDAWRSGK